MAGTAPPLPDGANRGGGERTAIRGRERGGDVPVKGSGQGAAIRSPSLLSLPPPQAAMSLQWTAVATFLYAEVFLVLLLCIPFVSAAR